MICSTILVLIALMWGATANNFYFYLNVWIALMHTTLIEFDCFDMGATAINLYCYLNVWITLTHDMVIGLIFLVVTTFINIYFYLTKTAATLLGLDCFDV